MAEVKQMKEGDFGVFTIKNGEIRQIGLTESESEIVKAVLASLSQDKGLKLLSDDYTFILKNQK